MQQGTILQNRYYIEKILGKGNSGIVYLAKDLHLNKDRAIKCVESAHSGEEMEILKEMKKEGFPIVTDTFWERDVQCIVMEYIEGKNLKEWREERTIVSEKELRRIMFQVAELLDCLHQQRRQIIYLDLKPENIMLTEEGRIRLVDFGAAICAPDRENQRRAFRFGTLGYASPEQMEAEQILDARSDIYSLGAVMRFLAEGTALSSAFSHIIEKCLEEKKENRYRNMEELCETLKESCRRGKRENMEVKCMQIFYYVSMAAVCIVIGAFLEQIFVESWKVTMEMGYYIIFLSILHYVIKIWLSQKRKKQVPYRVICRRFYTDKKGIGLLSGLLAVGFLLELMLVFAVTQKESILWLKDTDNRRVLIQQNSIYYYEEPFRFEYRNKKEKVFYQVSVDGGRWRTLETEGTEMLLKKYKKNNMEISFREIDLSNHRKKIFRQNFTLAWKNKKTPKISRNDISGVSIIKL